ncbi:MAG: ABC transporter permease [Eubacterium sp.]
MKYAGFFCVQYLTRNKKQAMYTIIGIIISTAFITTMIGFGFSLKSMFFEDACNNYGRFDCYINNVSSKQCDILESSDNILSIGKKSREPEASMGDYNLELVSYDLVGLKLDAIKMERGNLPQSEDEIALSTQIKINEEYVSKAVEIGEQVTIITDSGEKTYTLSGIIDDFDASRIKEYDTYKAIIFNKDINTGECTCFLSLNRNNINSTISRIATDIGISVDNIYNISQTVIDEEEQGVYVNDSVIQFYKISLGEGGDKNLISAIIIGICIIIIISIILLGSRMLLSVGRRRQEMAVLKMLGAYQYQIMFMLIIENMILGVIGIVIGNILSQSLQYALVYIVRNLRINSLDNISMNIGMNVYFAASVIMMAVLIIVSLIPVVMVAKLSPIEALGERYNISKNNYGPLSIVYKNMPMDIVLGITYAIRRRGRFVLTLFSVTAAAFIMLVLFTFIESVDFDIGRNGRYVEGSKYQYAVISESNLELREEEYVKSNIPYIETMAITIYPSSEIFLDMTYDEYVNQGITQYMDESLNDIFFPGKTKIRVYIEGEDEQTYNNNIMKYENVKLTYDEFVESEGCILVDDFFYLDDEGQYATNEILNVKIGNRLLFCASEDIYTHMPFDIKSYEVLSKVCRTFVMDEKIEDFLNRSNIYVVLPKEEVYGNFGETYYVIVNMNTDKTHIRDLGEWLNENAQRYDMCISDNVEEFLDRYDTNMILLTGIAFVAIFLTMTGSACIYYVIVTGIVERKTDINILRMLGMSSKQFKWMFWVEDFIYGFLAVFFSLIIIVFISNANLWSKLQVYLNYKYMWINVIAVFIIITTVAMVSSIKGRKAINIDN